MESYRRRLYQHYAEAGGPGLAGVEADPLGPRAAHLQDLIRRYFPPDRNAAILDLGCGHGALLHFLRQAGYQNTLGVDWSASQVAAAAKHGLTGIIQGDVLQVLAAQPAASRDVVVAYDLLEHFTRDELLHCLDEVCRVLKSGGRCIIHAPNGASPFGGRVRYGDLTHELALTRDSLTQVCRVCGFSRVDFFEDQPVPHGLKSGLRWLLWKVIRGGWRFYLAVETGVMDPGLIFTQNLYCIAVK